MVNLETNQYFWIASVIHDIYKLSFLYKAYFHWKEDLPIFFTFHICRLEFSLLSLLWADLSSSNIHIYVMEKKDCPTAWSTPHHPARQRQRISLHSSSTNFYRSFFYKFSCLAPSSKSASQLFHKYLTLCSFLPNCQSHFSTGHVQYWI